MLGSTALAMKAYADARTFYRKVIVIVRGVGQRDALSAHLVGLAAAYLGLGEQRQAQECIREALPLAAGARAVIVRVYALLGVALLRADQGEGEQAVELHALGSRYPEAASGRFFPDVFGAKIAAVAASLPPEVVAAAQERGRARDLGETIAELLAELDGGE